MLPLDVVIMAAGKGTRMKSKTPKVLHILGGRALLGHVMQTAAALLARKIVLITGHESELVRSGATRMFEKEFLKNEISNSANHEPIKLEFALQMPQLGTGHAIQQALAHLSDDGLTIVLSGDVPLTQIKTLQGLIEASLSTLSSASTGAGAGVDGGSTAALALLTLETPSPFGYGRVLRVATNKGKAVDHSLGDVTAIVEEKDATSEQKLITEVYTGVMVAPTNKLREWVNALDNKNAQGEYYLTDVVKKAVESSTPIKTLTIDDPLEVMGVNSPAQLCELERAFQLFTAKSLMEQGVRIKDPSRIDVRGSLVCDQDVEIDVNTVFTGHVTLGQGVYIGPNCVISNAVIEEGAHIEAYTHIEGADALAPVIVGVRARVGPFARLRPGAVLGSDVHIGNFVEIKNSTLANGAKANHLAYVGDAQLGERVNFGAGAITANYDGANKHKTVIEKDVHVGSNSVLVAPLTLGAGGTIGAGSTITKNTEPGALSITRAKQLSVQNWARPEKHSVKKTS
jgi:bifunctional UDP-N-acetylglucosamine pyrophosphorylase/glucosamine-1-phosphate N-acetyltransferase